MSTKPNPVALTAAMLCDRAHSLPTFVSPAKQLLAQAREDAKHLDKRTTDYGIGDIIIDQLELAGMTAAEFQKVGDAARKRRDDLCAAIKAKRKG